MKHIYTFLCLFLLSGVLSNNANAHEPDYFGDCVRTIKYSDTDFVLWNNKLPDTERWTQNCWSLVYYEDGKWYFDVKRYGELLLRRDQAKKRMDLSKKKRQLREQEIRKETRCHITFTDPALWNAGQPQAKDCPQSCWEFVENRDGKWLWK
jgi:hypothetical protein